MEVVIHRELGRMQKPPRGYVMVTKSFLKFGVRFSLNQFFRDILCFYGLTVFQVMPNGWAHMIGLFVLFVEWKMTPPQFPRSSPSSTP